MEKHVLSSKILSVITNTDKFTDEEKKHIETCNACNKSHAMTSFILTPSKKYFVSPPGEVKHKLKNSLGKMPSRIAKTNHLKKIATGSIAALIAACMVIALTYFLVDFNENKSLSISDLRGEITINNKSVNNGQKVYSGAIISAQESAYFLHHADDVKIFPKQGSIFIIKKISYDFKKRDYLFQLDKGEISAEFNHEKGTFSYKIITPNAEVLSMGTKFTLSVDDNNTNLSVEKGKVKLINKSTGEKTTATEGNIYTISKKSNIINSPLLKPDEKTNFIKDNGISKPKLYAKKTTESTNQDDENDSSVENDSAYLGKNVKQKQIDKIKNNSRKGPGFSAGSSNKKDMKAKNSAKNKGKNKKPQSTSGKPGNGGAQNGKP